MNPPSVARSAASPTRIARFALLAVVLALLTACASAPRRSASATESALANEPARAPDGQAAAANDVLFRAMALVGTPYHWGGNTPAGGFDCSGLVGYIYRNATGMQLPRTSGEMADMGEKIRGMTALVSGDLVFFGNHGRISHVGVYVGKGRFVHAPNSGGTVRLDDIDGPYWRDHFEYGRRVLD
ncbi:C40 family peptidase [Rhodanobacter sp. 7MK24]|uniref:NlpC/P60 family protein n=1 Tax=Rhodanobacter sp. 7MK24 TaxID=2775922 RepID=UPI0017862C9A|nr:C40 family peptidase [Rhodanobacter sp. 7MK24]